MAQDKPAGVFKFADQVKMVTMDPQRQSGGGIGYLRPVYESLFAKTSDGKAVPLLATDYKIDGLSVTITLRKGVTFSNGEPFDAKAVVANINRGVKIGILEGLGPVEQASPVDDLTVMIKLKEPNPSIIDDFTGVAGMMIAPKALDDPALDRNPVGTGPYVYNKELSREGEVRVYTPNPKYWDPQQQGLARYEIWEIPDDTARLNALKTGQVDAGIWLANPQAAIIDRAPGLKLVRNNGGYNYHLVISDREGSKVKALADKRVRKALSYAINREAFNKAIQFGLGASACQAYAKGDWAFDQSLESNCQYDPKKARALLAEAGYPNGFNFTMPSIPVYQPRLEALAGFFKDIGVTMTIQPVEPGTLARRSRTTDFPTTNLVWGTVTDPKFLYARYISKDGTYNPFKATPSGELTKLAEEGLKSPEIEARAPIYKKMAKILTDESYLIFITSTPLLVGVSEKIANNPTVKYSSGEDSINLRGLKVSN
ncbi:hypothetical protein HFC70_25855 [Agrobacterium sp. a22-2]|uniref:ABC transporter substrate-binding protein n=1 Tax=Agrobacterium sp. a22-2 TaxID=2283840 RepID=UPI001445D4C1|nr:ABC transporter substrate-binding protein [Agrobacterium sp. a22-2]NKN39780.1 hypothetical protein [Agrobacterium sp. a22-2]